jgi:F0F1-type ATP synthase epsilon subunit
VIAALAELGGSGRPDEVGAAIAKAMSLSEEEQQERIPSGVQSRFENQVHWARFYLAKGGYIEASQHGVWTLSDKARALGDVSAAQAREIYRAVRAHLVVARGSIHHETHATDAPDAPRPRPRMRLSGTAKLLYLGSGTSQPPASSASPSDSFASQGSRK